jgi:acyl-CoA thioester hydrolase
MQNLPIAQPELRVGRLARPAVQHAMRYRVVYADTDAMGVVYHARYLDIAERSRTEFIATAGIDLGEVERRHGILLLVNRVRADYRVPVLLHQQAEITSSVLKVGASQVWWRSQISVDGRLAANLDVATACFHKESQQIVPLPADLAERIASLPTEEFPQ